MRTNKTYIHILRSKLYNYYEPIVIMLDIEYIVLLSYVVNTSKGLLHVLKASPMCSFCLINPFDECRLCLRVFLIVLSYSCFGDYSHTNPSLFHAAKIQI